MKQRIHQLVEQAVHALAKEKGIALEGLPSFVIERPKIEDHGDFATNAALALAKSFAGEGKPNPRKFAEELQKKIASAEGLLASPPEIAGPGYLNFRLSPQVWWDALQEIIEQREKFGTSGAEGEAKPTSPAETPSVLERGARGRETINLEFVSANPTGPMHVGHGRGAAYGDAIARIMRAAGYNVTCEYYINDRGNQAMLLGQSVHLRYKELLGEPFTLPPDVKGKAQWYQGSYVIDIAKAFKEKYADQFAGREYTENIKEFRVFGVESMMARIKDDLSAFGISFDIYTSELALFEKGKVSAAIDALQKEGKAFEDKGALWFKTSSEQSKEGDEIEGRVLRKQSGDLTYFASDIAYHKDKFERGFTHLIDIWGADHHGYIPRMKDAMPALGKKPEQLEVLLVQFVTLNSSKVGKRSGNFVTLRELIDEVGRDATRFFFLMRSAQSQLDFDMDLAKQEGLENPVYHAQYGHARCCSIVKRAQDVFGKSPVFSAEAAKRLTLPEELSLLKRLHSFIEVVRGAADNREPHRVINFITELSQQFQSYYTFVGKTQKDPVLPQKSHREQPDWEKSWDWEKTQARLLLIEAVRQVMCNALSLAGVSAPEKMTREEDP